jgi:methylglutaconyl-CoA hydratase
LIRKTFMSTPVGLHVAIRDQVIRISIATEDGENRFSPDMISWLTEMLASPPPETRVLRIKAHGNSFCLGPVPASRSGQTVRQLGDSIAELNRAFIGTELITIAQVDGVAAGFGIGLACLPDITAASERASFVLPEVIHDLTPALVLSWFIESVGTKTATWMALTGKPIDAERARALGLTSATFPYLRMDSLTEDLIEHILSLNPATVAEIKHYLRDRRGLPFADAAELAVARMSSWAERLTE